MQVTCRCQICSQQLEFDPENIGQTVNCPHCKCDTQLYFPRTKHKSEAMAQKVLARTPKRQWGKLIQYKNPIEHMITNCPYCSQSIEADDHWAGISVECPACQKQFTMPRIPPLLPIPNSMPEIAPGKSDSNSGVWNLLKKKSSGSNFRIAIICFTILAGLYIWQGGSRGHTITITTPSGETIEVNVSAMKSVIQQDKELGGRMTSAQKQVNPKTNEGLDMYAENIRNYVNQAKSIDTSECPRDFAEAYFRHLSAWSDEADIVAAHPQIQSASEGFIEGMIRGMGGDITGGAVQKMDAFDAWTHQFENANSAVKESWQEVEALEIRYRAK